MATADHKILVVGALYKDSRLELSGHAGKITSLVVMRGWTDDKLLLVSGSEDGTVRVWDIGEAGEVCRIDLDAAVACLTQVADGRILAADKKGGLHKLIFDE